MTLRGTIVFLAGVLAALGAGWAGFPRVINRTPAAARGLQPPGPRRQGRQQVRRLPLVSRRDGSFTGIPTLDKCAACHAAPMGTTAAEKHFIDRYVTPQREPEWLVYARQPENVYFSHSAHVNARQPEMRALPRKPRQPPTRCVPTRKTASAATRAIYGEAPAVPP